jgi:transcriptional regulator with XRE-family HTH domain
MNMPLIAYDQFKSLRLARGLRQADMAMELGISRPTYVLMELGQKEPTITQLFILARLLRVAPSTLCPALK